MCCLNCTEEGHLASLVEQIAKACPGRQTRAIKLEFVLPPALDAFRVACRGMVCLDINSAFPFPTFEGMLHRLLSQMLKRKHNIIVSSASKWIVRCHACLCDLSHCLCSQVSVVAELGQQLALCQALVPDFRGKRTKRKHWETDPAPPPTEDDTINRSSIDHLLKVWKSMGAAELTDMRQRVGDLHQSLLAGDRTTTLTTLSMAMYYAPIYLYGRYCKHARDVSQSPWTIGDNETGTKTADEEDDEPTASLIQKGRGNVEDILGQAVTAILGAEQVKMHACGREDIDVRCLGNGRPFALEVLRAQSPPSEAAIQEIFTLINNRQGSNSAGDLSLVQLQECDVAVWECMQKEAEEKDKRYVCVVWTSQPVTQNDLKALELMGVKDVDTAGKRCMQIVQKTPLRVLHRRSLIDRPRYIYNIQTALLNPHYFIMDIDTSAGAYVKEFVHGDLGRTLPSVSSVLNCQAQILQLDVTWLYDGFGERFPISVQQESGQVDEQTETDRMSWAQLQLMGLRGAGYAHRT